MTASRVQPSRGEVWFVDLEPVRGREQGRRRPCLVVSVDAFNHGPAELAVVIPLTTRDRGIPLHVPVSPPEGGLQQQSYIKCEDIRSISTDRLLDRWGFVSSTTLSDVEDRLRILLGL